MSSSKRKPGQRIVPTKKQRAAAKAILNGAQSMGEAMRRAGYSETTALKPKNLTDTPGFKVALAEFGLTEDLIVTSLVEDIKSKPRDRLGELTLGSKILGLEAARRLDVTSAGQAVQGLPVIRIIDDKVDKEVSCGNSDSS